MFLGIRDAKQGAKPWGAEGGLVVEATQLSCAKTDKANQIAVSREQGLRVFCQTSGFDNERSNTALFLTSSDRSEMPGAVSSYYGPRNGSRPNAFWPKLLDPVNVPVCPLVTSHMSKDKENSKPDNFCFCTCLFGFNKKTISLLETPKRQDPQTFLWPNGAHEKLAGWITWGISTIDRRKSFLTWVWDQLDWWIRKSDIRNF